MLLRTYLLLLCLFGIGIFGEAQTKKAANPPVKTKEKAAVEEVNEMPISVTSSKKAHVPPKPPPAPKKSRQPVPPPPIKKAAPLPPKPAAKPQPKTLAKPPAPPSASYPVPGKKNHPKVPDAPPPAGWLA